MCRELEEIKVAPKQERRLGFAVDYIPSSSFHSLCNIIIYQLQKLLNLTWLIYIPSVEVLDVTGCYSMKEVIRDETGVSQNLSIFSRLRVLRLYYLPNLKSICGRALPFTSLTDLSVRSCPFLRKLPLDSNSATYSLKTIEGSRWWWDRLQWENETIKHTFNRNYFEYNANYKEDTSNIMLPCIMDINWVLHFLCTCFFVMKGATCLPP